MWVAPRWMGLFVLVSLIYLLLALSVCLGLFLSFLLSLFFLFISQVFFTPLLTPSKLRCLLAFCPLELQLAQVSGLP